MSISEKIKMAEFATKVGWIENQDWKTPKIILKGYRYKIQKKALKNAVCSGYRVIQGLKKK